MTVEVKSMLRKVTLDSPAAEGWTDQWLLVADGSTDQQVIGWATGFLSPEAVAELAERLGQEAAAGAADGV